MGLQLGRPRRDEPSARDSMAYLLMLTWLGLNLWRHELKLSHCQSPGPSATTSYPIAPPLATALWRQVGVLLRERPRSET
eukprot:5619487-Pyramimonas_sp.AAC.1